MYSYCPLHRNPAQGKFELRCHLSINMDEIQDGLDAYFNDEDDASQCRLCNNPGQRSRIRFNCAPAVIMLVNEQQDEISEVGATIATNIPVAKLYLRNRYRWRPSGSDTEYRLVAYTTSTPTHLICKYSIFDLAKLTIES
jgi:hypothetical protein